MIELGEAAAVCALARGFVVGVSCRPSQTSKGHDEAVAARRSTPSSGWAPARTVTVPPARRTPTEEVQGGERVAWPVWTGRMVGCERR